MPRGIYLHDASSTYLDLLTKQVGSKEKAREIIKKAKNSYYGFLIKKKPLKVKGLRAG